MQPDDSGGFAFIEVTKNGFADVGSELLPSIGFGDDGVAESTGDEAAVGFIFGDLENDFTHGFSLSERLCNQNHHFEVLPSTSGPTQRVL